MADVVDLIMELYFQIKMNHKLYVRDPEDTELGRKIIQYSIRMIHDTGFESFTFKKLAEATGTTEAGIYRYFENKHRLLIYIVAWYWSWLEYLVLFHTQNLKDPAVCLKKIIRILSSAEEDNMMFRHIDKEMLHQIVIAEGSKAYLTKHVNQDNKDKLFQPYKDLCSRISDVILDYRPGYPFGRSLASTIVEMAHLQNFFMINLPSLTDFGAVNDNEKIMQFLESLVFSALDHK